jgi:hypothetical protein
MSAFHRTVHFRRAFLGTVIAAWKDERDMVLQEAFSYSDANGKVWRVPAEASVNGASIPRPLWIFIGSPYVGRYRYASVIHDHYCEVQSETWRHVHWVFYDACLAAGVPKWKALLMYSALLCFGKKWRRPNKPAEAPIGPAEPLSTY